MYIGSFHYDGKSFNTTRRLVVGLRPVVPILCEVTARTQGDGRHFTEALAEVKCRASARVWGLSLHTRLERPVLILIITRNVPKLTKSTIKVPKILVYFDRRRHFDSAVPTRAHPPPVAKRHFPPERFHISAAKIAANSIKHNDWNN